MKRKSRGFLQTSGLLKEQIRKASESRGFAQTRLLTNWAEIAGPATAKLCRPIKVGYTKQGFGATLTVLTTGANAPMLQMQLPDIIKRVNSVYGYSAISRIKLTQTAPTGFGEGAAPFERPKPTKRLSPEQTNRIESSVKEVSDADLKDALATLGQNILTRNKGP
ncbi:hypothetical protein GCM10007939_19300 [Amylibacter marinus]|uniref:DUF721 domain-containing protein n=1 Tax=Amylibacter marinus TaxID=1475483 RepID=A0ABQ5VWG8_9RHOB|nr:DciA family protein [Amylibacter marinus]GLQ35647.1 hypothetical protein GCM10007939_19300 [Amylibacter marinus]